MPRRPYWRGYLKLSLVSCPILLFPASSDREKVSFHQLNKKTGHRIQYRKVDAETGREVDADDIVKAYEVSKGKYIEFTPDELAAVALESQHTIEIDSFRSQEGNRRAVFEQPLLHRARWQDRRSGVCRDPRSHSRGRDGRPWKGGFYLTGAHYRARTAR